MSLPTRYLSLLAPIGALALGGCATGFSANVARFQALPPPSGQTYTIQPADQRNVGGLEFGQYAALVAQRLDQFGYRPAAGASGATLVVTIDYGVDRGHQRIVTTPGLGYGGFGYGGFGYGRYGYGGFGRRGFGWGGFGGFGDPFFDDFGPDINSYTVYGSHLDMTIRRAADGQSLFEGHAKAMSGDDALPHLVPNLIEAMFTGFPGHSGETVRITVPPMDKQGHPPMMQPTPDRTATPYAS